MTLRHLQIFVDVVDNGKMVSAADKLYISQSSVSQAIADLESTYQVKLFERLNKRLYITEAGRDLLGYARSILTLYKDMDEHMNNMKPMIRIGSTFSVAASVMSEIIQKYNEKMPLVKTEVVVERTGNIENLLLKSEIDLAIVEGEIKSPDLILEPLVDDELFLICPPSHPFFAHDEIDLCELQGQPFVQREIGSYTRWLLEHQLSEHNIQVNNKWICNNSEAIKSAVISGQGLAVMSGRILLSECKNGQLKLIRIRDIQLSRQFTLVYHRNKYLSESLQTLMAICRQHTEQKPNAG